MDFDNIGQIDTGQLISGYALSMDIETGRWIVHSYTRPLPYVCAAGTVHTFIHTLTHSH